MNNWDFNDQNDAYDKWANWTINPPRSSNTFIKCASAITFLMTAGTQLVGIVA